MQKASPCHLFVEGFKGRKSGVFDRSLREDEKFPGAKLSLDPDTTWIWEPTNRQKKGAVLSVADFCSHLPGVSGFFCRILG